MSEEVVTDDSGYLAPVVPFPINANIIETPAAIRAALFAAEDDSSDDEAPAVVAKSAPTKATKTKTAEAVVGKRGPVYTAPEELMACKAFIAASEDAQVGTSQKGKHFKNKMFKLYNGFLVEQERRDAQRLALGKYNINMLVPAVCAVYDRRSPDAIYDRFKLVSHKCSKLLGIESTTTWESGWDQGKFDSAVNYHLETKWPKLGSVSDIRLCFDYLKGKPKWNAFMDSQVTGNDKHQRPNGKKKDKMLIKDKSLIKEVVKQLAVDGSTASGSVAAGGRDAFFEQAGLALAVYCKAQDNQQEMIFLGMMATPEKKEVLAMKREVMLAKLRAEKRKFDSIDNSESVPSCVLVGSNEMTTSEERMRQSSSSMSDEDNDEE